MLSLFLVNQTTVIVVFNSSPRYLDIYLPNIDNIKQMTDKIYPDELN